MLAEEVLPKTGSGTSSGFWSASLLGTYHVFWNAPWVLVPHVGSGTPWVLEPCLALGVIPLVNIIDQNSR